MGGGAVTSKVIEYLKSGMSIRKLVALIALVLRLQLAFKYEYLELPSFVENAFFLVQFFSLCIAFATILSSMKAWRSNAARNSLESLISCFDGFSGVPLHRRRKFEMFMKQSISLDGSVGFEGWLIVRELRPKVLREAREVFAEYIDELGEYHDR